MRGYTQLTQDERYQIYALRKAGHSQKEIAEVKRVFDLVKDFGTSESPKSTRSSTIHWCPGRPGHPAFRHNITSSLRLHTGLPYDWTPRSDAPLGSPLAPSARRVSRIASQLPGTTRLRFALHGGQRMPNKASSSFSGASVCSGRPIHHQYHKVNLPGLAFFVA